MKQDLLIGTLRELSRLTNYTLAEWDVLIRQARNADLLARIAVLAEEANLLTRFPAAPRAHLESALVQARAQSIAVRREVHYVAQELSILNLQPVLLKGAAYLMADLPAAKGRLFSDLDILVPRSRLTEVEGTLMLNGWATTHHAPYDQRYYREWMHELPPMQHIRRMTIIDVHHAIVPATADLKPASDLLLAAAKPLEGGLGLRVLAPADMILHSATHLFYNEEFSHGLRDMSDLDLLLRHFAQQPDFWPELLQRSKVLGLTRPLYYCLRYCTQLFATPIPVGVLSESATAAPQGYLATLMDRLWLKVLSSLHPSASGHQSALAQHALYIRAHWHKMPLGLLMYHTLMRPIRLARKEHSAE